MILLTIFIMEILPIVTPKFNSNIAIPILQLGETILPMKEDFIMVHLQPACTHCCLLMVSGTHWVCNQCKNFRLCER